MLARSSPLARWLIVSCIYSTTEDGFVGLQVPQHPPQDPGWMALVAERESRGVRRRVADLLSRIDGQAPAQLGGDAVREVLCFGWIDSKVKPIDDERYKQIF